MGKKKVYPKYDGEQEKKAGKLLQHKHCNVCGKAVPVSKEICSDECQGKWDELTNKRKRSLYIFYIAMAILIVLFFLQLAAGA